MHFSQVEGFKVASQITGPRHNLLHLKLTEDPTAETICECLPPQGNCQHAPLDAGKIIAAVHEGVQAANQELGTSFFAGHIKYVQNDTGPESAYGYLALSIIRRVAKGEQFA